MKINSFVFFVVIFLSLSISGYGQTITLPHGTNPTTTRLLCSYSFNQGVGVKFSEWVFPSGPENLMVSNSSGSFYPSGIYDLDLYVKWKNIEANAKTQTIKARYYNPTENFEPLTAGPFHINHASAFLYFRDIYQYTLL